MKRDPALVALSHDHHQALFAARKLRQATDGASSAEARTPFVEFWQAEGERHFELEEQILLPAYAAHGDPHHPLVARALCEHVDIRLRAHEVLRDPAVGAQALNDLGARLASHVRLEERYLFPLIEQVLPEEQLATVAAALAEARECRIHA